MSSLDQLREDALEIWQAGLQAVTPARLFADKVRLDGRLLSISDLPVDLSCVRRLVVLGAGKAAAAMAIEFQRQVLSHLPSTIEVRGWVNCPEGTFEPPDSVSGIQLYAARPAGINEPTQKVIYGTKQILDLAADCDERDLVICLLSGGGSALLAAPPGGITLADKQAVARYVAARGGDIQQLNAVRRVLSNVKGGGLARTCQAGRLITVILSDVLGDSLETIASGPTVLKAPADPAVALQVLDELQLAGKPELDNVLRYLRAMRSGQETSSHRTGCRQVDHVILGNNADAVDAAGVKAVELGYRYVLQAAQAPEGDVSKLALVAADAAEQVLGQDSVDCWISGGEPTVRLPDTGVGKGGRNQQLALAVMQEMSARGWPGFQDSADDSDQPVKSRRPFVFLSGGTDGEDGPTDAAGALFDQALFSRAQALGLEPQEYLSRADAYSFFDSAGGLIRTGPTGTNVCDLRVALAERPN